MQTSAHGNSHLRLTTTPGRHRGFTLIELLVVLAIVALASSLVAPRYEARLGARLSEAAATPWVLRHPGRLIVTGAVGSALGVGVTAYAVWRSTRRSSGVAHRLLQR